MVVKKTTDETTSISVIEIDRGEVTYHLLGMQPMIFNRINEKARRELLLPSGRKNEAEKQASLKHDPVWEFRSSPYRHPADDHPTRLYMPPTAIKAGLCTAALDMPKTRKTQIGRLVWIEDRHLDIWGVPLLYMTPVRQADINRTPDIRTRALLPRWAARVTISYAKPLMREPVITSLLNAAGFTVGIGDYRQEKGKGSHGQFRICDAEDPEFLDIVANEGREAQDHMLELAQCYDAESEDLLTWYNQEILRRNTATAPKRRRSRTDAELEMPAAARRPGGNGEGAPL